MHDFTHGCATTCTYTNRHIHKKHTHVPEEEGVDVAEPRTYTQKHVRIHTNTHAPEAEGVAAAGPHTEVWQVR